MVPDNCDCDSAANYGGGSGAALQVSDMTQQTALEQAKAWMVEALNSDANIAGATDDELRAAMRDERAEKAVRDSADIVLRGRGLLRSLAAPPVQSEPVAWRYKLIPPGWTYSESMPDKEFAGDAWERWQVTPLYAAPQARDGWIPASEQLPDIGQLVVCRYAQGTVWAGQYHSGIKCVEWLALPALAQEKENRK